MKRRRWHEQGTIFNGIACQFREDRKDLILNQILICVSSCVILFEKFSSRFICGTPGRLQDWATQPWIDDIYKKKWVQDDYGSWKSIEEFVPHDKERRRDDAISSASRPRV